MGEPVLLLVCQDCGARVRLDGEAHQCEVSMIAWVQWEGDYCLRGVAMGSRTTKVEGA